MVGKATVVILAAGQGTRMRTPGPKVLAPLCGRPMIAYVVDQALGLEPNRVLVVVAPGQDAVREALSGTTWGGEPVGERLGFAVQEEQNGTGDAVRCALPELPPAPTDGGEDGPVLVLYGDMPCLRPESLARLVRAWEDCGRGVALLTACPDDPRGFGRIVRGDGAHGPGTGDVRAIVEERDASPDQRAIREVNLGVYAFSADLLRRHLPNLSTANEQGELYLTDVLALAVEEGAGTAAVQLEDPAEAIGVNTLAHLAEARAELQERILLEHLAAGVHIEDPSTTYVDHGVEIGPGTTLLPCTVLRAGVRVGAGCEVGPFTHLRTGTVLRDGAEVGNFTECKQADLGEGTKAKHLSYLGDVTVGSKANIGAGTIVANYDGVAKHPTSIGDRAFVGSGSILIAPSTLGEGVLTGAGAVVTRGSDIPDGEAWVGVPARPLRRASDDASDDAADDAADDDPDATSR